jgi:hypothetical protein
MTVKIMTDNLVMVAQAYAKARRITLAGVGHRFYGNANFFAELRTEARSMTIEKYFAMIDAMRADWPDNAAWPFTRALIIERHRRPG